MLEPTKELPVTLKVNWPPNASACRITSPARLLTLVSSVPSFPSGLVNVLPVNVMFQFAVPVVPALRKELDHVVGDPR